MFVEIPDDKRVWSGVNYKCIESSNLSVCVQMIDIVKMEPLGF